MMHLKRRFITVFLLALLLAASLVMGQDTSQEKDRLLTKLILMNIGQTHYNPRGLDDALSKRTFSLFIQRLDYNKRFFLAQDIETLKKYELTVDDEVKNDTWNLFTQGYALLEQRIREAQSMAQDLLAKPFDFTVNESMGLDPEQLPYCAAPAELKDRWRKLLKYQTMLRYFDLVEAQNTDTTKTKTKKLPKFQKLNPELEAQARAKVDKSLNQIFKRLQEKNHVDRLAIYLNCITNSLDPHTMYFPPEQKEDFDIEMTGTLEGIGAMLQEEDGYIKVSDIVPGSASWRQKELKAGDIILKVAQGAGEPEDIVDMPIRHAVKLIRGKKGTEVRLTVKKPDGHMVIISIIRDMVIIEETYARSALISDTKQAGPFGYIYLPKFYHDFKNAGSRNSADDIRAELEKLKSENVKGVILDLRNNGGGSLDDAVKMAGLFIDQGPIVQVRNRNQKGDILYDQDPATVYSGPLVVLLNSNSASASEIVGAALQDYGRAALMGGSSSFGKGTVQTLMDLDNFLRDSRTEFKPLGSLKLTIQKFYRINGGATQYKGVIPDITVPDLYEFQSVGEKTLDYPMPWDTIASLSYQKWDRSTIDLPRLNKSSSARVNQSPVFQLIRQELDRLKKRKEENTQPLNMKTAWEDQKKYSEETEALENLEKKTVQLSSQMLAADAAAIADNADKQEKLKEWIEQLRQDAYIEEGMKILEDMQP